MSILIAPVGPLHGSLVSVVGAELELAPASAAVRSRCLVELACCASLGLWVADSPEHEFGLRVTGPLAAVFAAWSCLQPLGEAVAVAPFVHDAAGRVLPAWA